MHAIMSFLDAMVVSTVRFRPGECMSSCLFVGIPWLFWAEDAIFSYNMAVLCGSLNMTYMPTKDFSTNRIEESGQNILLTKHPLKIGYSVPGVVTKCNYRKNRDLPQRIALKDLQ